ncbi:MAG TPA: LysR substrate-binding domain-containing protein [Novosphingobium sp.]|nr:LysR substrate-binding domain-containing protein [Novosphingobium sp.]
MQDADWSDYQAFLAIARAGQLAGAGRMMGLNATTIGRRLRRLESRLGTTLFEQTREGQLLTPAGEALLAAVEQMAQAASGVEPASSANGPSGSVRISVSEGFGSWIVARHLGDFAKRYPGLAIDLVASNGFLSPSRREADIAVLLSRPQTGPLIARKLADYALRLYASPAYLAGHAAITGPACLAHGHQLIGYIPDLVYAPELNYLTEIAPDLAASLRSSSILAQHRLLAAGAGIGVLPCFIGDADPALVRVLPDRTITRAFWLVTHKDTHQLQRIRLVTRWLADIVKADARLLAP